MSPITPIVAGGLLLGLALVIALSMIIIDSFARAHHTVHDVHNGDFGPGEEHPRLIDLDTGHEYEWVDDADPSGYANVADHEFTWPRDLLERMCRLAELRSLDSSQIEQLRAKLDQ